MLNKLWLIIICLKLSNERALSSNTTLCYSNIHDLSTTNTDSPLDIIYTYVCMCLSLSICKLFLEFCPTGLKANSPPYFCIIKWVFLYIWFTLISQHTQAMDTHTDLSITLLDSSFYPASDPWLCLLWVELGVSIGCSQLRLPPLP